MKLAVLTLAAIGLSAQMTDNREKKMSCEGNWNGDHKRVCKITEQTLGALGRLTAEGGHNGGVTVRGWAQNQTLVRAKVEAWAETDGEATLLAGQIHVDTAGGVLRSSGPEGGRNRGWAVSWEVFAPHATDLKLATHNGGVHVSDIRGRLELKTHNGGLHVSRVTGEVTGSTHNGGIHAEILGPVLGQVALETHNGGIDLRLPQSASARVHAETRNGRIQSDFPVPETPGRDGRQRNVDFNIGSGGAAVRLVTNNGGVQIRKI